MIKTALRWSGAGLVAGALILGGAIVLASLKGASPPVESLLLLVGSILLMLALPGLYARQAERAGWDWWAMCCWK